MQFQQQTLLSSTDRWLVKGDFSIQPEAASQLQCRWWNAGLNCTWCRCATAGIISMTYMTCCTAIASGLCSCIRCEIARELTLLASV